MSLTILLLDCLMSLSVGQLGDRSYRRRDNAHRFLASCKQFAVVHLQRAEDHPNPEVARRATLLLEPYADGIVDSRSYTIMPTSWPRRPWLSLYDCQAIDYLDQARTRLKVALGAPNWPE